MSEEILEQRQQTHGDYRLNAELSQNLLEFVMGTMGERWFAMAPYQRHSIQMICMKLARVAVGKHDEIDHWRDISGYAELVVRELEEKE